MNIRIGRKTCEETYFLPEFWLLFQQISYLIPPYILPGPGEMRKNIQQKKTDVLIGQTQDREGEARELNGLVRNDLPFESICVIQIITRNHICFFVKIYCICTYICKYIHNYIHIYYK